MLATITNARSTPVLSTGLTHHPLALDPENLNAERSYGLPLKPVVTVPEILAALCRMLRDPLNKTLSFFPPFELRSSKRSLPVSLRAANIEFSSPHNPASWKEWSAKIEAVPYLHNPENTEKYIALFKEARDLQAKWGSQKKPELYKNNGKAVPLEVRVFLNASLVDERSDIDRKFVVIDERWAMKAIEIGRSSKLFGEDGIITKEGREAFCKILSGQLVSGHIKENWFPVSGPCAKPSPAELEIVVARLNEAFPTFYRYFHDISVKKAPLRVSLLSAVTEKGRVRSPESVFADLRQRLDEALASGASAEASSIIAVMSCNIRKVENRTIKRWYALEISRYYTPHNASKKSVHDNPFPPLHAATVSTLMEARQFPKVLCENLATYLESNYAGEGEAMKEKPTKISYLGAAHRAGAISSERLAKVLLANIKPVHSGGEIMRALAELKELCTEHPVKGLGAKLAEIISQQEFPQTFHVRVHVPESGQYVKRYGLGAAQVAVALARLKLLEASEIEGICLALRKYKQYCRPESRSMLALYFRKMAGYYAVASNGKGLKISFNEPRDAQSQNSAVLT